MAHWRRQVVGRRSGADCEEIIERDSWIVGDWDREVDRRERVKLDAAIFKQQV